jgi:hypothetical protein
VGNESFPIGFVMSPSESSALFMTFPWFINLLGIPNYTANSILSDEGSALQADASRIGAEHFLCSRHILKDLALAHPSRELSMGCYSQKPETN